MYERGEAGRGGREKIEGTRGEGEGRGGERVAVRVPEYCYLGICLLCVS